MRKIAYAVSFVSLAIALILSAISAARVDWLVVKTISKPLYTTITDSYGLHRTCELTITQVPGPGEGDGKITYRNNECRPFPNKVKDDCDGKNQGFCAVWTGAAYVDYVSVGFGALALLSILFGMSTRSRRMRVWRALAGLAMMQTLSQVITFAMITDTHRRHRYPGFEHARPGMGYVLCILSWVLSFLVTAGVVVTGLAADKGHRWAVGNRRYEPIRDYD
ncbi:hypothetical protein CC1G_09339 [Coprinopsis cinerea okayama7|uniref:Uncharacterized protein n=1 Tax=Coprinopsis cinerea (strain Okayama-7 / 130 / ATCC MYA-4618 / FGSC 9003) TaxID=240176 RepID=A8N5N4_COPC7|nr:hypothetical protein CC1G_09339 [Coprinopsis cinerea okayama7\|eukprot:XP_001830179.1 hypothetical protein CC1G_09339 [Coprinopsis cinerea okayama7\